MRRHKQDKSYEQRLCIYRMHKQGKKIQEIAKSSNLSESSISRELKLLRSSHREIRILDYKSQAEHFHQESKLRRKNCGKNKYVELKSSAIYKYVEFKLELGFSPEIISNRLRIEVGEKISPETIYQFIYKHRRDWIKYLVRKGKSYRGNGKGSSRKRKKGESKQGQRHISERPDEANTREELGHIETDLIVSAKGGKSHLQVNVDRASRQVKLQRVRSKEASEARQKMFMSYRDSVEGERPKTLTADNGSEHQSFMELEKIPFGALDFKVYYCTPYSSWERGTVEAINGIIRQKFPKRTNFDDITDNEIKKVEEWFNNRGMKVLDYYTPNEYHHALLNDLETPLIFALAA